MNVDPEAQDALNTAAQGLKDAALVAAITARLVHLPSEQIVQVVDWAEEIQLQHEMVEAILDGQLSVTSVLEDGTIEFGQGPRD